MPSATATKTAETQPEQKVAHARRYKLVTTVEVPLLPEKADADQYGFRDYSRDGVLLTLHVLEDAVRH